MRIGAFSILCTVISLCLAMISEGLPFSAPVEPKMVDKPERIYLVEDIAETRKKGILEHEKAIVDVAPTVYFNVDLDMELQDHILMLCQEYSIDPALVMAIIWKESNFNPECSVDSGKSLGLMQVMAKWHVERMERLGCDDLTDPYQNVTVGIDFLAELIERDRGIEWALMAYNGGASYANRKASAGEVSAYVTKVLGKADELRKEVIDGGI